MAWVEDRLIKAEGRIESLYRRLMALVDQVKALADSMRANAQQQPSGAPPSDGGGGVFVCLVPSPASGSPPTAVATFSAEVFQMPGLGSKGIQTIRVGIPGPTVANKWGYCLPDGSGGYVLISQSCN